MRELKVFFDTEFTGLHKDTTLISIGLVSEHSDIFYGEVTDYDKSQVTDWIKENVIVNLSYTKYGCCFSFNTHEYLRYIDDIVEYNEEYKNNEPTTIAVLRRELEKWFKSLLSKYEYDSIQLISDVCHYDMTLFIDIFGGAFDLPKYINPCCHDINQDIAYYYNIPEGEAFDKNREEIAEDLYGDIKDKDQKHNAIYDALIIKLIYKAIC